MFRRNKKQETVVEFGPRYKTMIEIHYRDVASKQKFEIITYYIEDGFLIIKLRNYDTLCIATDIIRDFEVHVEEIQEDKKEC